MKIPAKLPQVAAVVAFLLAAIGLLSAAQQIALAIFALIPLAAGIGILRKRIWSAYGFAIFEGAQLLIIPILLTRMGNAPKLQLVFTLCFNAALALLFWAAGRALAVSSDAKRGWALPWLVVACAFVLPFFFVQAFVVPSGGMEDTLLIGDRILTLVFPKIQPADGELVVFHYPVDKRQVFVKRVIGAPGDRIHIANGIVYRNGAALKEPYAVHKFVSAGSFRDNFPSDPAQSPLQPGSPDLKALNDMLQHHVSAGEVKVPPGNYFVLGDNRDNSLDSRYWGFVASSDLIGRPFLIYDSQEPANAQTPGHSGSRIRWNRVFKLL